MLQEFDGAARLLGLDPGIWKVLTHPEAPDHRVLPDPDGQRRDRGLHRLPRAVQHHARAGQGRHPLPSRRHARRSHRARRLDDLEMRRRAHPVRRRQGRHHLSIPTGCRGASSRRSRAATSPRSSTPSARRRTCRRPTSTPTTRSWRGSWTPTRMHVGHTATAVVTGKPIEMGGSLGRREATGRGVMIVTREAAKHLGLEIKGATVAVQGFGNVGSVSADLLAEARREDRRRHRLEGRRLQRQGARHREDDRLRQAAPDASTASPAARRSTTTKLFELDVDVLIPAALENQITMDNAPQIKAKIIAEGANGPTTPDAHKHLHEQRRLRHPRHPRQRRRRDHLVLRVGAGSPRLLLGGSRGQPEARDARWSRRSTPCSRPPLRYKTDMRTAAYIVAINRVATVTKMRGMYA